MKKVGSCHTITVTSTPNNTFTITITAQGFLHVVSIQGRSISNAHTWKYWNCTYQTCIAVSGCWSAQCSAGHRQQQQTDQRDQCGLSATGINKRSHKKNYKYDQDPHIKEYVRSSTKHTCTCAYYLYLSLYTLVHCKQSLATLTTGVR